MGEIEIKKANRGVRISRQGDGFYSIYAVNTRNGFDDCTVIRGKFHSTETGARKWAAKQLEAA